MYMLFGTEFKNQFNWHFKFFFFFFPFKLIFIIRQTALFI